MPPFSTSIWAATSSIRWPSGDVPFVFVTGYDAENIDTRYAHVPVLQKPIEREVLQGLFVSSVNDAGKPAWHVSLGLASQSLAVAGAPER